MAGRRCPAQRCPRIITGNDRYCPTHAREYEAKRGTPTQRGYGPPHRALRAAWQRRIDAGEHITCACGCGQPITGTAWDLGHDHERGGYLGPQLARCNRSEGGRRGSRASKDQP